MDFSLGEECEAVRDLAREILTDHATPERLREVECSPARVDERLWADLASAGLLAAVLPEADAGAGLGMAGLCVLLQEQGRLVAPVPLWPALTGALTVAAHGTAGRRAALLADLVDGGARLTVALEEFGPYGPLAPRTTAAEDGAGWRLTGVKAVVPAPAGAAHVLVTAATGAGPGVFLVAADAPGVSWEYAETTSHDLSAHLTLDGARAEAVGTPGGEAFGHLVRHARLALAALQAGVADGALGHAAAHLREREQFGRPLATFQAVQHQLADCYIDIEAMRVTLWQAVDALAEPFDALAADRAALVAQWWAAEGGLNTVHRVQHVHGGIGVDTDYPVHRHFLWGKQISTTLGGPGAGLDHLGALVTGGAVTA
ncbi:acyl-CoA dehydrogenase [Streptomyces sp. A1277]|uniref:acyl-CoA dehydrogenase family protein n=1 Tax=Streptomyces sp. A1277 TaxID=2563103 RepID=UPI0010A281F7|nr:acyl-CoA dehydrogenase family protein [Streptomyces sp. A1277]THA31632.1 acyl-CoA dehydrogenase [Streptomyces sp. A1277]